jgi:hypothetical protein
MAAVATGATRRAGLHRAAASDAAAAANGAANTAAAAASATTAADTASAAATSAAATHPAAAAAAAASSAASSATARCRLLDRALHKRFDSRNGTACSGKVHRKDTFVIFGKDVGTTREEQLDTASVAARRSLVKRVASAHITGAHGRAAREEPLDLGDAAVARSGVHVGKNLKGVRVPVRKREYIGLDPIRTNRRAPAAAAATLPGPAAAAAGHERRP